MVQTLLADDHAVVRAGIRNALEEVVYLNIVGEVGDGPSLMVALDRLKPDLLLIDVTMPDFEPITTIRAIRARFPRLSILVVSAYDDDLYVQGLLSAGVNGYHLKDRPLSDLRLAVERVLAGERWISGPLLDKLLRRPDNHTLALSGRQREMLRLLAKGLDNQAIARQLSLSIKTVENHLTRLYRQIGVLSRLEAATYAREHPELLAEVSRPERGLMEWLAVDRPAVLVVDDNQRYRDQLRRMIGKVYAQAQLYEASHTAEALQLVQQVAPQLIFIDVVLGDEDGIRCTRQLKASRPAARIILISAYPDREFHRLGLEAGATAFLDKKDVDVATLQQIIDDLR